MEIGERIEVNIQEGKVELIVDEPQSKKGSFHKKKDDIVNLIQPHYLF